MLDMLPLVGDLPQIEPGRQPVPGPLDIDIWRHDHGADPTGAGLASWQTLLSDHERARADSLGDRKRRRQFVTGRALCRRVLSFYAPVPPQDWQFVLGTRGKPALAAPRLPAPLGFSLSHARGVSVCAVTGAGAAFGIDIEPMARGRDALPVADQFFPQAEVAALRQMPPSSRAEAFVRLWALKESFAKARESSLAEALSHAAFDCARADAITLACTAPLDERAGQWQFNLLRLDPAVILAVAVKAPAMAPLRLRAGVCPAP